MPTKIIGSAPYQIPRNSDLGSIAYQDSDNVNITGGTIVTSSVLNDTNVSDVKPSLLLDFANSKSLDPKIEFTRASTGVYYDGETLALAEQNLLTYSENFSVNDWAKNLTTSTVPGAVAPNGTLTACVITALPGTGSYGVYAPQIYFVAGKTYTFSVYAKANTTKYFGITIWGTTDAFTSIGQACFDLSAGTCNTVGSVGTSSISYAGNGWYRCVFTATATTSNYSTLYFTLINSLTTTRFQSFTSNNDSVFIWGAQVELRSQATAYTPTTTQSISNYIPVLLTAPVNTPRFDHDPVTGESKGLLLEDTRTNLVVYSNDFDCQSGWGLTGVSVFPNCITAPDGNISGTKFVSTSAYSEKYIYSAVMSTSASTTYTASIYVKAAEKNCVLLEQYGSNGGNSVFANLSTNEVSVVSTYNGATNATGTITNVGNGWYRITNTLTTAASSSTNTRVQIRLVDRQLSNVTSFTGNNYDGIFIFGAQFEAGLTATSYIPNAITWTQRTSTATYIGNDGYLDISPNNTLRRQLNHFGGTNGIYEVSSTNLCGSPKEYSTSLWNFTGALSNPNVAIAPDGSMSASKLYENNILSQHYQGYSIGTVTIGTVYTFSVYVKAAEKSLVSLTVHGEGYSAFDIKAGSVIQTGGNTCYINYVGNGWYRLGITTTKTNTNGTFYILGWDTTLLNNYTGTYGSGFYVWGAQIEQSSTMSSFIPNQITYTGRTSTATYYDSASTALGEQNLVLYSGDLANANFGTLANTTILSNVIMSPDGTISADQLFETAVTNYHVHQTTQSVTSGLPYTFSAFFKKGTGTTAPNIVQLGFGSAIFTTNAYANFDINSGTVGTVGSSATAAITSIGNGWYRCSITSTAPSSGSSINIIAFTNNNSAAARAPSYLGVVTSDMFVWGVQFEQRSQMTSYVPTTSAAVTTYIPRLVTAPIGVPRYEYDPVTRVSKDILMEITSANILLYSEDMSNAAWAKTGVTVQSNLAVAPDGAITGDKLVETSGGTYHLVSQTVTLNASQYYSASVFAKAGERNEMELAAKGLDGTWSALRVNLTTGTIITNSGLTGYVIPCGGGWYRCMMTFWSSTGAISPTVQVSLYTVTNSYLGDGMAGLYIWGAQLEAYPHPTSYIPTTSAAVTRSSDSAVTYSKTRGSDTYLSTAQQRANDFAVIYGSNLNEWYRQDEGTFVASGIYPTGASRYVAILSNTQTSSAAERIQLAINASNKYSIASVINTTVDIAGLTTNESALGTSTFAVGYKLNDWGVTVNGGSLSVQRASARVPSGIYYLTIGSSPIKQSTAGVINGCIKYLKYYPKRLSDNELVELSV